MEVGQHPPEVGKDPHWDIGIPEELPYTVASLPFRINNMETAAENLKVPIEQQRVLAASDMEEAAVGFSNVVNASTVVDYF